MYRSHTLTLTYNAMQAMVMTYSLHGIEILGHMSRSKVKVNVCAIQHYLLILMAAPRLPALTLVTSARRLAVGVSCLPQPSASVRAKAVGGPSILHQGQFF